MTPFIVIAIIVIVVAAVALVAGSARRRDLGSATGQLSRETLKRDASRRKEAPELVGVGAVASGKEIERAVILGRSEAVVPAASSAPTLWVPPDPETIGVTRRQFLNRSVITMMTLAISSFAAAASVASVTGSSSSESRASAAAKRITSGTQASARSRTSTSVM